MAMLYCCCGFSCGTRGALERHFLKKQASIKPEEHVEQANPPPVAPQRSSSTPSSGFLRASRMLDEAVPKALSGQLTPIARPEVREAFAATPVVSVSPAAARCFPAGALRPHAGVEETDTEKPGAVTPTRRRRLCLGGLTAEPARPSTPAKLEPLSRSISGTRSTSSLSTFCASSSSSSGGSPCVSSIGSLHVGFPGSPDVAASRRSAAACLVSQAPWRSSLHGSPSDVRLLLVRHAQSANRRLEKGQRASPNPELSEQGYEQAHALGLQLVQDFSRRSKSILVVSSPMRRCLLTIQPAMAGLRLPPDACLCHGGCYEFGCAGKSYRGAHAEEIAKEFPGFAQVGFDDGGWWDYRGVSEKETEAECRERGVRVVEWLRGEGSAMARARAMDGEPAVIVLCAHRTFADLLCRILLEGDGAKWSYGEIEYQLHNAAISELLLHPDGRATRGARGMDSTSHLSMPLPRRSSAVY